MRNMTRRVRRRLAGVFGIEPPAPASVSCRDTYGPHDYVVTCPPGYGTIFPDCDHGSHPDGVVVRLGQGRAFSEQMRRM